MLDPMSPAAVASVSAAAVSLLMGLVALGFARGRGARAMRWYAAASLLAGLFAAANVVVVVGDTTEPTIVRAARFTMSLAGFHGASWLAHDVAEEGRRPRRFELLLIGGSVGFACAALVPGWLVSTKVVHREACFGIVYRDALPTPFGVAAYAYYCAGLAFLALRNARRVWSGSRHRIPHLVGLTTLVVAAVLDSLAASQLTRFPYLLDVAFMVVVLCVGASVGSRFVETARALEESAAVLATTQAELVQRERLAAVGEMSAVVAHEVRNPLAVMFNALPGLRRAVRTGQEERAAELVTILQEEADRLRRLVDDFLDFTRPLSLRPAATDARTLVESAVEMARAAVPSTHRLVTALDGDLGELRCDAQLVRHAIANLVENALQIEGPPVEVTIRARAADRHVVFEVSDRGPGIPSADAQRLYEPFFTTRAQGTGLGLTLVKRVVEAHFGTIVHRETAGGGATFVVELPRWRMTAADDARSTPPPA